MSIQSISVQKLVQAKQALFSILQVAARGALTATDRRTLDEAVDLIASAAQAATLESAPSNTKRAPYATSPAARTVHERVDNLVSAAFTRSRSTPEDWHALDLLKSALVRSVVSIEDHNRALDEAFLAGAQAMREVIARQFEGSPAADSWQVDLRRVIAAAREAWSIEWGADPGKLDGPIPGRIIAKDAVTRQKP